MKGEGRGALAELVALALLPLILWSFRLAIIERRWFYDLIAVLAYLWTVLMVLWEQLPAAALVALFTGSWWALLALFLGLALGRTRSTEVQEVVSDRSASQRQARSASRIAAVHSPRI